MKHRWLGPWRASFDSCTNVPPRRRVCRDRGPFVSVARARAAGAQAGGVRTTAAPDHAPVPGGRAPLRGAASHEAEGGAGTDRVGPPPG